MRFSLWKFVRGRVERRTPCAFYLKHFLHPETQNIIPKFEAVNESIQDYIFDLTFVYYALSVSNQLGIWPMYGVLELDQGG